MQRVHLRDDGLTPERVRTGKDCCGRRAGEHGPGELGAHEYDETAGDRRLGSRGQVQAVRAVSIGPHEEPAEREIQGVAVARRDDILARDYLERGGVAEVESRKKRRAIERERDDGHQKRRGGPGVSTVHVSRR